MNLREIPNNPRSSDCMIWSTKGSIVVGIDYDCQERMVYWTDVAGRAVSRASLEPGAEPETVIHSGEWLRSAANLLHFIYFTNSLDCFMPVFPLFVEQGRLSSVLVISILAPLRTNMFT